MMMSQIISESHSPYVLKIKSAQQRRKRPRKEYQCGIGQIPFEG